MIGCLLVEGSMKLKVHLYSAGPFTALRDMPEGLEDGCTLFLTHRATVSKPSSSMRLNSYDPLAVTLDRQIDPSSKAISTQPSTEELTTPMTSRSANSPSLTFEAL